ncbi:MAG: NAD(P)H-hydrate dehydratase, partial [Oxalobacteraceae bacterium]
MSTRKKPRHNVRVLDAKALARWPIPDHGNDADKEGRGHVLVVAGSEEVPGAALLAAVAALRAGAGKLTVAAPRSVSLGLALAIPEARVIALDHGKNSAPQARAVTSLEPLADSVDAVVIGPGMLEEQRSMPFVRAALALFAKSTVVLDAVAMSVAKDTVFSQPVVLTPHAGEMAHLLGNSKDDVCANAEATAIEAACRWNACVALKGSSTVIAMPSAECWRFTG